MAKLLACPSNLLSMGIMALLYSFVTVAPCNGSSNCKTLWVMPGPKVNGRGGGSGLTPAGCVAAMIACGIGGALAVLDLAHVQMQLQFPLLLR